MAMEAINEDGVSVHTGFPNPATDSSLKTLSLEQLLIKHPVSTFLLLVKGNQWEERGIFNDDIVVVDRVLRPRASDLVIWWQDDSFVISPLKSVAHAPWGVVTSIIHQYRH